MRSRLPESFASGMPEAVEVAVVGSTDSSQISHRPDSRRAGEAQGAARRLSVEGPSLDVE